MSIYIKGMVMPTNDELLCIRIYPNGKVTIDMDLECKQIATAVPVPPHGRLVEADKLIEKRWDADTRCGYVQVVDVGDIESASTIIPAEEGEI